MNFGIGNNDITKNYYNLDIPGKRQELYSEFYDLMAVMHTLLKNKYGEMDFPSLDSLNNLKNKNFLLIILIVQKKLKINDYII